MTPDHIPPFDCSFICGKNTKFETSHIPTKPRLDNFPELAEA